MISFSCPVVSIGAFFRSATICFAIVDVSNLKKDFTEVCDEMDTLGKEIGVSIRCQREEIFEKMHRL